MFYDRYVQLCEQKGVRPSAAAEGAGVPKSAVSNWKDNWKAGIEVLPTNKNAIKLANYFDVPIGYLLGTEKEKSPVDIADEDIKFALFKGNGEITDAMFEEVKTFARFIQEREAAKGEKDEKR